MDIDIYQKMAEKTANKDIDAVIERLQENKELVELLNWSQGLSGESGELTDHIKKVVFQGHELDKDYIAKELGDLLWYISQASRVIGMNLSEIADKNIIKLYKRYPGGFDELKSINRKEYQVKADTKVMIKDPTIESPMNAFELNEAIRGSLGKGGFIK